jgi:hypothetical protein
MLVTGNLEEGDACIILPPMNRPTPTNARTRTGTHSPQHDAPFQVIKGMELGVASMSEGERAELKIR